MPQPDHYATLTAQWVQLGEESPPAGGPKLRTMGAQLATYGQTIRPQSTFGLPIRMEAGAIEAPEDVADVKMLRDHDEQRIIGAMTEVTDNEDGPYGRFKLARTALADESFSLVQDGILNGVSVGCTIHDYTMAREDDEDIVIVTRASLREVSIVGHPADSTARIDSITAQRKAADMAPQPAAPEAPVAAAFDQSQLDTILAHVRDNLAPAQAAPTGAPGMRAATIVDQDGNPLVFANARYDRRYPGVIGNNGKRYTAGDFFASYARGVGEGDWAEHHEIRAALADELTSDVPGLLPTAIIGELLGRASGRRTVWESLSPRDMPMAGAGFSRPRITQHVLVNPQSAQKTEIASRKYTVALDPVSKTTLAGGLDVAQQAIDWTSPALLNELIIDFTRIYLARTDTFAGAALVAATTTGAQNVNWDGTGPTLNAALAAAAVLVFNGITPETDSAPNTIWVSPDVWAILAGLTDADGRPLLPQISPTNASGQVDLSNPERGVFGGNFRWIVSKRLPAGTFIMGDATYAESYENGRRFLQAVRPDVLGLDIAYMGYVATYFPYPKTLVKITIVPPEPEALTAKTGK